MESSVSVNVRQPEQAILAVRFKKLTHDAKIPQYAKPGDAGLDLTATSYRLENGRHVYGTGLAVEIPFGHVGLIFPRSSITKYDLRLTNAVGVIDSGYRGEITFHFESDGLGHRGEVVNGYYSNLNGGHIIGEHRTPFIYRVGDRIGQLVIMPYPRIEIIEATDLDETERGTGGFGSSGV